MLNSPPRRITARAVLAAGLTAFRPTDRPSSSLPFIPRGNIAESSISIDMKDCVHRSEAESLRAELDAALDEIETANKEREAFKKTHAEFEAVKKRLDELQGKVRTRTHRDAAEKILADLKVKTELRDDLYELAKIAPDSDEPDPRKLKDALAGLIGRKRRDRHSAEWSAGAVLASLDPRVSSQRLVPGRAHRGVLRDRTQQSRFWQRSEILVE